MAYLAFIANPRRYFPIRPQRFEKLARYYGIGFELAGYVEWNRYERLLEMAEDLRGLLDPFGPEGAIDVQSYMWVVSYLIEDGRAEAPPINLREIDWATELERRRHTASEKERLGLLGENSSYPARRRT